MDSLNKQLRDILDDEDWKYTEKPAKIEALIKAKQLELLERVEKEVIKAGEQYTGDYMNEEFYQAANFVQRKILQLQRQSLDTLREEKG